MRDRISALTLVLTLLARSALASSSFAPVRCGRLHIVPSHAAQRSIPGCVPLVLDVDEFTFLATREDTIHVSTRMLLEWLEAGAASPSGGTSQSLTCLDYGCGSGILGIAALRLDVAQAAILTDISEGAVACARANAELNGVAERCECVTNLPSVCRPVPVAGVVVANMLAGPLCSVALDIAGRSLPGCKIALSGFRRSEVPAVKAAYEQHFELDMPGMCERDGWMRLCGSRRADEGVTLESLSDSAVM